MLMMKPILAYPVLFFGTMVLALLTVYAAYSVKPELFVAQPVAAEAGTPSAHPDSMRLAETPAVQHTMPEDTVLALRRTVLHLQDSVKVLTRLLQQVREEAQNKVERVSAAPPESSSLNQNKSQSSASGLLPASLDSVVRTDPVAVARIVETMNVEQAVKVLEHLNDDEAKSIIKNINKRQVGKILSAIDPKRVARLIR
jgi:flagellar motility protein MotE (MotC chaperone)